MKNSNSGMPTANIAINKSRLKIYDKNKDIPTYYLTKGQEFQIELFNPTTDNVLCKIHLNNKPIAQGGLVIRPGERVFLDRYIDVAKKFMFDTYTVSNSDEVKKAIQDNGDFKVFFHKEYIKPIKNIWGGPDWSNRIYLINQDTFGSNLHTISGEINTSYYNTSIGNMNSIEFTTTSMDDTFGLIAPQNDSSTRTRSFKPKLKKVKNERKLKSKKSIETGRVAEGSTSNQQMTTVHMDWEISPFHTVEYKLLPVSQKVNTTSDLKKRYCTNCGTKQKATFKFCPSCGNKV